MTAKSTGDAEPLPKAIAARRRAIAAEFSLRAAAAGYDAAHSVQRLRYGAFASVRHHYLYVETPKAACSSWKQLIVDVEGAPVNDAAIPHQRETRIDMLIHQRRNIGVPDFFDLEESDREGILSGSAGWFVFAMSRNPFSRLVSMFENKVRTGEPGYRAMETRYGDGAYASPRAAFANFVRSVAIHPDRQRLDAHLRTQVEILMPGLIAYGRVFKVEQAGDAVTAFAAHVRAQGFTGPIALERRNESRARSWRDYYEAETAELVAQAYAGDFAHFGYDPDDWRGGKDIVESVEERRWRAEVVARNALIDRLYTHLGLPERYEPKGA
jgi:hypothetical protein